MDIANLKVLVCVNEFWGAWNTAWGGYGFLARMLLPKALGVRPENFHVCLGRRKGGFVGKFLTVEKRTTEEGYTLLKLPRIKRLAARIVNSYDLVISIEATVTFIFYLDGYLKKKILFWVQDPRETSDWDRFKTIKCAAECNYYSQKDYDQVSKCFRDGGVKFVTQGRCLSEKAIRLYKLPADTPMDFLPNPIEIDYRISELGSKEDAVIFLGRLDTQKRGWIFCEIAKRMPQYQFYMMGQSSDDFESSQNGFVNKYAGLANLHFMGRCVGQKKDSMLRKARILVNCSIHEGVPVSFLEAFWYGDCVISSLDPDNLVSRFGIALKRSDGDGYDSVDGFVDAISTVLEDRELWLSKVTKAYEYVSKVHCHEAFRKSLAAMADGLELKKVE